MFKPQFAPMVEAGTKLQTVRPTPKRLPKAGDKISLRTWTDKPYRSKQRVLMETTISDVKTFELRADYSMHVDGRELTSAERAAFALADGFGSPTELYNWFEAAHGLPFVGVVIHWHNRKSSAMTATLDIQSANDQRSGHSQQRMVRMRLTPINLDEANAFVAKHHRHHKPTPGHKFSLAVAKEDGEVCGVAIVGRPVARRLDNGWTLEVNRCCTDGTRNACSMLYQAAWRVAKAMGYQRLITYTLPTEGGASLRGAGWKCLGERGGGNWNVKTRPRVNTDEILRGQKWLWEAS